MSTNTERNCIMRFDFRNEETNERKTIYQVVNNTHYTLIHKKNGVTVAEHDAQNVLILILKHISGNGWKSTLLK